jgi:heat shock protein HslJ
MNTTPSIIISLMIVAGMIVSACASEGDFAGLSETAWRLVSYGPVRKQTPAAVDIKTSLDFGKDGWVSGKLGCNGFSGNYAVIGGKIVFTSMISLMMACSEPLMTNEIP